MYVGTNTQTDIRTLQVGPPREVFWGTDTQETKTVCLLLSLGQTKEEARRRGENDIFIPNCSLIPLIH